MPLPGGETRILRNPSLFVDKIKNSKQVKFLGIVIDEKLNWNAQRDKAIEKARISLWTSWNRMGTTWGIVPITRAAKRYA